MLISNVEERNSQILAKGCIICPMPCSWSSQEAECGWLWVLYLPPRCINNSEARVPAGGSVTEVVECSLLLKSCGIISELVLQDGGGVACSVLSDAAPPSPLSPAPLLLPSSLILLKLTKCSEWMDFQWTPVKWLNFAPGVMWGRTEAWWGSRIKTTGVWVWGHNPQPGKVWKAPL